MTIEEKAKRYDEALEIAKEINNEQRAQPFNVMTRSEFREIIHQAGLLALKKTKSAQFSIEKERAEICLLLFKCLDKTLGMN